MNFAYTGLLVAAIALMQLRLGGGDGTRLIYGLPSYLLLGLAGLLSTVSFWRERPRVDRSCFYAVMAFSIYLIARILLSPVAFLAQVDLFVLLASLTVYFLTAFQITESRHRMVVIGAFLLMAVAHIIVGVIQFARFPDFMPFSPFPRPGAYGTRASGFFVCPDHLAGFLEVVFLMGTSLVCWSRLKHWVIVVVGYLTLVSLAGIVLTGSRGGYASTAAGLLVFGGTSMWTVRAIAPRQLWQSFAIYTIAGVLLACVVVAISSQHGFLLGRMQSLINVQLEARPLIWKAALKQFTLAPVFGTGSRTYFYYGRQFRDVSVQTDPMYAHCDYLQLLAEYGVAGFVLMAAFLATHVRQGYRRWQRTLRSESGALSRVGRSNALAVQLGALSATGAFMVHSTVDFNLHIPANSLLMAFVLGILATSRAKMADEAKGILPWLSRSVLPLVGLWLLTAGIPLVRSEWHVERARIKIKIPSPSGAIHEADLAIQHGTRNPDLYFYLGEARRMFATVSTIPEARASFMGAAHDAYAAGLALFPQDRRLAVRTAWSLDKLGRFDEAELIHAKARELDPNSPVPWGYSALHARLQGREDEALAYYRKARQLDTCGTLGEEMTTLAEKLDFKEPKPVDPAAGNKSRSGLQLRD
jgi:O-antigen ligase